MKRNSIIYISIKRVMDVLIGLFGTIFIVLPCFLIIYIIYKIKGYKGKQEEIIKGDATSLSIAAASIVAKVTRDRMMVEIDREFPEYKFAKHKGYGTKLHREILLEKGPCKYHRKSFLKKILGNEDQNEMSEEKNSKRKSGNKVDENRGLKLF